ncbi:Glycosyltransferase involved in cell wall bisynthesis [Modicisalibacter ilicicola DSM 19980]|uniref:Glycosyltransferase involved in cell wall bisynthesis n=1 Tax=Modicisalibacter ilicicola DSM 19980 TaxID=1121942 RepID=A0A1M4Y0P2_9GAMM|nr:glycosyltransferase family 4 protein [Halomonas ilicicola]SHE99052.1 Glycosyltransferase involved in cell wall bisynthesis [Halomonas ilicicola DSM 19980]
MSPSLTLIVAGDPEQFTGGYLYDARIVEALRRQDWNVEVIGLEGSFPEPDETAAQALEEALARQPDGTRVVIDGLAMGGLPEIVAAHRERLTLTALIHHPLADETGLDPAQRTRFTLSETLALGAVGRIIATSPYTARRLADFAVPAERVAVIEPGVEPAPLARRGADDPTTRQHLLCVATVIPRKGHDVLLEALSRLRDRDWQCDCIGALDRDKDHAATIADELREQGLEGRIRLLGERSPDALREAYQNADLFILPSRYEGYGMVITEALARGLPVITTTGGALAHTLPEEAGLSVPPDDPEALADALQRWFDDPELRTRLRDGAGKARSALKDWHAAGQAFAAALLREPGDSPDISTRTEASGT